MTIRTEVYLSSDTGVRGKQIRNCKVPKVTWKLNDLHTAEVWIHPLNPDALLIKLEEVELSIVLGDAYDVVFQCVPRTLSGTTQGITFGCDHIAEYLDHMFVIDTDKIYTATEQQNIATAIVTYGQAAADADRGILIGTYSGSGVFRDRQYLAEEYRNVGEIVREFQALDDGFDWDIVTASDGSRRFTPYYPRKGSQKDQYPITMDKFGTSKYFRGLKSYSETGVNQETDVMVTGPQDATSGLKLRGRYQASAPYMTRFGRKQIVLSDNGLANQAWLDDKAAAIGLANLEPQTLPAITVSDELFNKVWHGDSLPVLIDWGRIQVAGDFRITQIDLAPATGNMDLTFQAV